MLISYIFGRNHRVSFKTFIRLQEFKNICSKMSLSTSEQPSKRQKVDDKSDIIEILNEERKMTAKSVVDFKFNKQRVKMISKELKVPENCSGIAYWMSRDQRVQDSLQHLPFYENSSEYLGKDFNKDNELCMAAYTCASDNWAFLYAQRLALKQELPLYALFCLSPEFSEFTYRHYHFLLQGLKEVEQDCCKLSISFHLLLGVPKDVIPVFVKEKNIGGVLTDFSPLRGPQEWVKDVQKHLPPTIPFGQPIDWDAAENFLKVDRTVEPTAWAQPGTKAGLKMLQSFCSKRLKLFADKRNDPTVNALSNLSPWIHFGQISAHRCVLEVKKYTKQHSSAVNAYVEEAVVRRELSDNFCFYQRNYDKLEGAADWAKTTLELHKGDKRDFLYSRKSLEEAKTHDDLWNSAQLQLLQEGKMHGFLRMYWAKKILEWMATPEEALATAIYLNDRYSLDGSDANGFVGCMWSICGLHDQGWAERAIFGKIRYMNYAGCKRKFDVKAFVARYGGKEYKYIPPK